MTERKIIERICGSYGCDKMTAKEYLDGEIRHLRQLQEMDDLQPSLRQLGKGARKPIRQVRSIRSICRV